MTSQPLASFVGSRRGPDFTSWRTTCFTKAVPVSVLAGYRKAVPMPTSLPERSRSDLPPSRREIVAICIGCGAVLVVLAGLIGYDARVIIWVSDAAQAEFVSPDPTVASQPVQLAVRKAPLN